MLENDEDAKFEVGLQFSNKKEILEAIKTFAIISKKNLKVKKIIIRESLQSVRIKKGCPFYLRVSKSIQATYWQVVTFKYQHSCFRTARNIQATPKEAIFKHCSSQL